MRNNFYIKILSVVILTLFSFTVSAEENVNVHQYNFYTGNFDFSDEKQKAILVGFQHQNENLERNTFLGNVSPITGGFVTENSAAYVYTGIEWNYAMGDKIKFAYDILNNTQVGFSYSHISNNDWGKDGKNPGVDNKTISFSKNF